MPKRSVGIPRHTSGNRHAGTHQSINTNQGSATAQVANADRVPKAHQGVAALRYAREQPRAEQELGSWLATLNHAPLLLVLDGVTDPHNLGACLRSAEAAGADAVIVPKDKSAPLNAAAHKAASGAAERLPLLRVSNLARCLAALKQQGLWLVGLSAEAANATANTSATPAAQATRANSVPTLLYEQQLTGPLALLLGAEGTGLRRLTRDHCDFLATIPMAGSVGSLNVSVAAGIALFEAVRQRQQIN